MSEEKAAAPKKSKKLLIIIIIVVLILGGAGAGGVFFLRAKAAKEAKEKIKKTAADKHGDQKKDGEKDKEHGSEEEGEEAAAEDHKKGPPIYVPLDRFTFNLAEANPEKTGIAQIEMQVEVSNDKVGEQLKNIMPAIKNDILMLLTGSTEASLSTVEGKKKVAEEILVIIRKRLPKDKDGNKKKGITALHFTSFIMN